MCRNSKANLLFERSAVPRVRNGVARFVCGAASAVLIVGGIVGIYEHRNGAAVQDFTISAVLAAVI